MLKESFSVWKTFYSALSNTDDDDPAIKLDVISPKLPIVLKPGDQGKMTLLLTGAQPSLEQLRAALGHGVIVEVLSIEPADHVLGAVIKAMFSVDEDASAGMRDLRVQFGNELLQLPDVLQVHVSLYGKLPVADPVKVLFPPKRDTWLTVKKADLGTWSLPLVYLKWLSQGTSKSLKSIIIGGKSTLPACLFTKSYRQSDYDEWLLYHRSSMLNSMLLGRCWRNDFHSLSDRG